MSIPTEQTTLTVALVGNPNTGKSTLFGALVGVHQHVGNYPGVTVEKKTGRMQHGQHRYELVDLPGLFSLAPRSRDEMVAVDLLLGRDQDCPPVDAVVCIVDAANLQRNLYLVSQVLEFGLPTVVAVNMLDVAENHGITVDVEQLAGQLPVPVVAIQANRRVGIERLQAALAEAVEGREQRTEPFSEGHFKTRSGSCKTSETSEFLRIPLQRIGSETPSKENAQFPEAFEDEVTRLQPLLTKAAAEHAADKPLPRFLVRRLLLDADGYLCEALLSHDDDVLAELRAARTRLSEAGCAVPGVETATRYGWARDVLSGIVTHPRRYVTTVSDRIDRVLTHRIWGTLIFALLMTGVFQAVFKGAEPLMWVIEQVTELTGGWVEAHMAEGALQSLLADGVIGGVGGVAAFLPQILILFLFIAILEDCGYMARAAFLMDKMMVRVGLSGKSFIPMLASFACAIPGIMATRVIENERDRLTTILVAPLMTCSARLPVYTLMIAAFIPSQSYLGGLLSLEGLTLAGLYVLGIVAAVVAALVLKRTILRGTTPPFVMELPSYKWPSPRTILLRVVQRGRLFIRCAGTLILAASVLVWAALYFPHNAEEVEAPFRPQQQRLQTQLATLAPDSPPCEVIRKELVRIDNEITGAYQRQSLLGRLGRVIEPAVKPLGWDWRIGCSVVASLPAREVVVATMAVIYNQGEDVDIESQQASTQLQAKLAAATWDGTDRPVFNVPVAMSILVFFALCAQCTATLAVIRRETNSWRWPVFTFTYMTTLAYLGALTTYQVGMWIST